MTERSVDIEIGGETLSLLADRAASWARASTLFVADLHLGKPAAFRAAGIPVPEASTGADLRRLSELLDSTGAERLVILGDLLHSKSGRAPETIGAVSSWRQQRASLDVVLLKGNHDDSAGDPPADWSMRVSSAPVVEGPFVYAHDPEDAASERARGLTLLCGHLHPAVSLAGAGRSSLRARCFWLRMGSRRLVFPAFGAFTGSRVVRPAAEDRVFVLGDGEIVEAGAPGVRSTAGS